MDGIREVVKKADGGQLRGKEFIPPSESTECCGVGLHISLIAQKYLADSVTKVAVRPSLVKRLGLQSTNC